MLIRASVVVTLLLLASTAQAQSLKLASSTYLLAAAADKATTLNCTLRVGCSEATPVYAWLDRTGGPRLQMAVSTSVDVASVLAWNRLVGKKHPKLAKAGLFGMAAMRGFIAVRNYHRVSRSY